MDSVRETVIFTAPLASLSLETFRYWEGGRVENLFDGDREGGGDGGDFPEVPKKGRKTRFALHSLPPLPSACIKSRRFSPWSISLSNLTAQRSKKNLFLIQHFYNKKKALIMNSKSAAILKLVVGSGGGFVAGAALLGEQKRRRVLAGPR